MIEIRCKMCDSKLGNFCGKGEVKCRKVDCGAVNKFDTNIGMHEVIPERKPVTLKNRTSSSGVRFY